jgi:hypothetical protein
MLDEARLKRAEMLFLASYPDGFADPAMVKIGNRHRMAQMVTLARECFSPQACKDIAATADNMVKVVGRSSMVSMFEKPRFRDFVKRLQDHEREFMVNAMDQCLHGDQQSGFEAMVGILQSEKLAKWSLVSIIPAYYAPDTEVFVKPTTAKGIIKYFGVEGLEYKPRPSWAFYCGYRDLINRAKLRVDPSLSPSNAAFSGFLMMSMQGEPEAP